MLSQLERDSDADLGDVAARARDFLLAGQRDDGTWRDFFLPAGESRDWVTGYAGAALAESGGARATAAARRGWEHLRTALKPEGGWGYNAATPPDADSTVWALRLAEALGEGDSPEARSGYAFLERHARPGGGVATYATQGGPRSYVGLPDTVDFGGWVVPHACVSAAAASLPGAVGAAARGYLPGVQHAAGDWSSYWWFEPGYATAEAVDALGRCAASDAAAAFARSRIDEILALPVPLAFGLAQCVRILARCGKPVPTAATDAIALHQAENGSWPASARLRVPPPAQAEPGETGWRQWQGLARAPDSLDDLLAMTFSITSLDHRRVFTTATVLRALTAVAA